MKYSRYKDIDKIDIEELKKMQSTNLLRYVEENNIDDDKVNSTKR